ncbi:MAG: ribonuclease D [Mariprofundus sp.]|nr:ribonuclease D [Mariprofundus sp.]
MSNTPIEFINTAEQLNKAAPLMGACSVLCVDTEFHRESTYYPEFALLQIYGNQQCWVIDPITLDDMSPVWEIMTNPNIIKVFHAARQDVEIIFKEAGGLPLPLFDTQVAAALLGYGQQVGFGNLVQRVTKKLLPKGESFTDWKARPLTAKQMEYAADDVIWLMPVYQHLKERLEAAKRTQWLQEEQLSLTSVSTYQPDEGDAVWRVKGAHRIKGRHLVILREMAAWRERSAQKRDIPRRRMIADEPMLELARREHLSLEGMPRIRGLNAGFIKRFGGELVECWKRGMAVPEELWPKVEVRKSNTSGTDLRLEMLGTLVRLKAEEGEISTTILASKSDLSALASWGYRCKGEPPEVDCLHGWRYDLVGHDVLRLLRGEICLHISRKSGLPEIASYEQ